MRGRISHVDEDEQEEKNKEENPDSESKGEKEKTKVHNFLKSFNRSTGIQGESTSTGGWFKRKKSDGWLNKLCNGWLLNWKKEWMSLIKETNYIGLLFVISKRVLMTKIIIK